MDWGLNTGISVHYWQYVRHDWRIRRLRGSNSQSKVFLMSCCPAHAAKWCIHSLYMTRLKWRWVSFNQGISEFYQTRNILYTADQTHHCRRWRKVIKLIDPFCRLIYSLISLPFLNDLNEKVGKKFKQDLLLNLFTPMLQHQVNTNVENLHKFRIKSNCLLHLLQAFIKCKNLTELPTILPLSSWIWHPAEWRYSQNTITQADNIYS